ncbi:hypothetical protein CATYP_08920 [Corynebacterium atypicum]|uniref:DUF306 domain-containing protein n=1 Tax=Corynebacterium atypicum TaxID=191610 RepID=A0ABM5QPF0_9CORY|nr:hypothetical protein [Corynebacterium atypicum]AIG64662.1 hypothetical protein CATYP_08920 [Corynebacterium atypicum]
MPFSRPIHRRNLRRGLVSALCAGAVCATADCAQDPLLDEATWQVTAIYTEPGQPAAIPAPAAGIALLAFGKSTISGFTGCVPIQAMASYFDDHGQHTSAAQASRMELNQVTIANAEPSCEGPARHVHDELVPLLHGAFKISHVGSTEIVLTQDVPAIDAPAIRMAAS